MASRLSGRSLPGFSRPLIRIAIAGVALSLAVMILSVAIVRGFQHEIKAKVAGFSGHIQISRYDANQSFESSPIPIDQPFYRNPSSIPGLVAVQPYAVKAGIIKTEEEIHGVVFKGVNEDFNWNRFSGTLLKGTIPHTGDTLPGSDILISRKISELLELNAGEEVRMYFVSGDRGQLRGRKFRVSGIYETGMEEFDRLYVIGDLRQAQRLNLWDSSQVSGFELFIQRMEDLEMMGERVFHAIDYDLDARTVATLYPQIFEWLKLQDMNVIVILVLMILVSSITMVSALLIIILERTSMIGVLKALGARDRSIRRIFLLHAGSIALKGMLMGNLLGLGLAVIQHLTGWVKLSQESYYIAQVPVLLELWPLLALNLGTLLACLVAMIVPSYLITRIQPVKVITMR